MVLSIARHTSQPSTEGPSTSMIRWTSGVMLASRNASDPSTSSSHGSSVAAAARTTRCIVSALICTSTARNSSSLPPRKWWYSAPRVTPARLTISSVPTPA